MDFGAVLARSFAAIRGATAVAAWIPDLPAAFFPVRFSAGRAARRAAAPGAGRAAGAAVRLAPAVAAVERDAGAIPARRAARHASKRSKGSALSTCSFSSPARRAANTPYCMNSRFGMLWASVSITNRTPRSRASLAFTSERSVRSGWALISIATSNSAARANTRSRSSRAGSRMPILRPVG